jgi:hypothetical protein
MGCCGCDPTTTKVCGTITDACDGTALSGVAVTVKDSGGAVAGTATTDGSGNYCVGLTKIDTYTIAFSKTGYFPEVNVSSVTCTPSPVVITACGDSVTHSTGLYPNVIPVLFTANICCGCDPTGATPITVTVTQTSGGTFTGTCTISSSAGCIINLPAATPLCGTDFVFTVTYTGTGFVTQTQTITLFGGSLGFWNCPFSANAPAMVTPSGNWCSPGNDCFTAMPRSVNVTLATGNPSACPPDGTYACALISTSGCDDPTYQGVFSVTCPGSGPTTVTITVHISTAYCTGSGSPNTSNVVINAGSGGTTLFYTGGSVSCPIAFTAGATATVHE